MNHMHMPVLIWWERLRTESKGGVDAEGGLYFFF